MKTAPLFLRFLLGATLACTPIAADAKPKKGGGKQRNAAAGQARLKAPRAPQRAARPASRPRPQQRVAKAPAQRRVSKPARSKPRAAVAQQRRVSPPARQARASTGRADRRADRAPRQQRKDLGSNQPQNLAAIQQAPQLDRDRKTRAEQRGRGRQNVDRGPRDLRAGQNVDRGPRDLTQGGDHRLDRRNANRRDSRADRREARVETAQERERRAQRVRERERISPTRKQQIAERQERRRDRVERFRENRQRRFAAVQNQRRAIRAARVEARREYAREVREEIREYWEDRADEIRDRIRDRRDYLFDDDWWEHRHWYSRGPILVSDPWWWWRPARWGSVNVFINAGWSEPIDYDYGTDVIYDEDVVYVRGEPVGSRIEYSREVVALANSAPPPPVAEEPVTEESLQPLGVWALAQENQGDAIMFFQLSVNRDGVISGAFVNVVSGEEQPISGKVDRQTQRAAWHIGDQKEKVFEAGMSNLTKDQASCLVHLGDGEMQNWLLVRMPDPSLPDKPATLGQSSGS